MTKLGSGRTVVPAGDRSVWLQTTVAPGKCTLRRVSLAGDLLVVPHSFPCAATLQNAGSLGLVVNRTRVIDPGTTRTVLHTPFGVLAAARNSLVLARPEGGFTLLDPRSKSVRKMPSPSILTSLDNQTAVDPSGRYVAVAFSSASWKGGKQQVLDLWVIDTFKPRFIHLPSMPSFIALKQTRFAWSAAGQLVVLGETTEGAFVAVWRPGQRRLALKRVQIPQRNSGSPSFAVLG